MGQSPWTIEKLRNIVPLNISVRKCLQALGVNLSGSNYSKLYRDCKENSISITHFKGQAHLKGNTHRHTPSIPLEEILVENSTYTNMYRLKKRLLKEKLLIYQCEFCGISNWKGADLSLEIDHINGIHRDNSMSNLRLLCPNCHSQTPTYAGRNKKPRPTRTR